MQFFSRFSLVLSVLMLTFFATHAFSDDWNSANDPANFDPHYEYHLQALPLKATLSADRIPWSESYWPRNTGSIDIRWNAIPVTGFDYVSPTRDQVMTMTRDQLAQLSPAEKYDLAMGRYNYPLTTHVAQVNAYRYAKDYEGICDGWSATAVQFKEPKPVDFKNPDGIVIPFGSSDVKAIMAYSAAFYSDLGSIVIGTYCTKLAQILGSGACQDINPGSYHVILANEIGLKNKAFVADVEPGPQTWNQPIYGFEFTVVGSAVSNSNSPNAVQVHSKMHYTDELDASQWQPVTGTPKFASNVLESDYILEMDASGKITGGSWLNGNHPDVFWRPSKAVTFTGDFAGLNSIYQPIP
jgi:hypothetical protein